MTRILLVLLLIFVLLNGCSTERRAIKKLGEIKQEFPQLFEEIRDTTYVVFIDSTGMLRDTMSTDSVVFIEDFPGSTPWIDTLYIEGPERVTTRLIIRKDTIIRLAVRIIQVPDTIPIYIKVPVEVIKEKIVTDTKVIKKIPFWAYFVGFSLLFSTLALAIRS